MLSIPSHITDMPCGKISLFEFFFEVSLMINLVFYIWNCLFHICSWKIVLPDSQLLGQVIFSKYFDDVIELFSEFITDEHYWYILCTGFLYLWIPIFHLFWIILSHFLFGIYLTSSFYLPILIPLNKRTVRVHYEK